MNLIFRIASLFIILLVFALSTGFSFYQLNCNKSFTSSIYFSHPHGGDSFCNMSCAPDDSKDLNESCCSNNQDKDEKEGCCDIKEIIVLEDFDFISFVHDFLFDNEQFLASFHVFDHHFISDLSSSYKDHFYSPPNLIASGQNLRIQFQSFII